MGDGATTAANGRVDSSDWLSQPLQGETTLISKLKLAEVDGGLPTTLCVVSKFKRRYVIYVDRSIFFMLPGCCAACRCNRPGPSLAMHVYLPYPWKSSSISAEIFLTAAKSRQTSFAALTLTSIFIEQKVNAGADKNNS